MGTFESSRHDWRGSRGCKRTAPGGPLRPRYTTHDRADKPDYKTAALCKQVRRVVGLTLAGECGDPVLQSLIVEEVLPAPNAGRLLVRVLLRGGGIVDVLQRLDRVHGLLRARVGESIARKRTPELTFDVIPLVPPAAAPDADSHDGLAPEDQVPHA